MREPTTAEEAYDICAANGAFNDAEPNQQKLLGLLENAKITKESAERLKAAKDWMNAYRLSCDALGMYAQALVTADKMKISDKECLFAYLCVKYPDLELDWNFFEKVRAKENNIYTGEKITFDDWKEIELQVALYISAIKKEVEKKISKV